MGAVAPTAYFYFGEYMPTVSFSRIATVADDGSYQRKYLSKDPDTGLISTRTEILEDTIVRSVSDYSISNVTESLTVKVENISSQITESGKLNYETTDKYTNNSISVFLNGVMINADITDTGDKTFSLSADYSSVIATSDILIVSYVKDSSS